MTSIYGHDIYVFVYLFYFSRFSNKSMRKIFSHWRLGDWSQSMRRSAEFNFVIAFRVIPFRICCHGIFTFITEKKMVVKLRELSLITLYRLYLYTIMYVLPMDGNYSL